MKIPRNFVIRNGIKRPVIGRLYRLQRRYGITDRWNGFLVRCVTLHVEPNGLVVVGVDTVDGDREFVVDVANLGPVSQ